MKEEKNAQTEAAEAEEIKEEKTQNPAEDSAEACDNAQERKVSFKQKMAGVAGTVKAKVCGTFATLKNKILRRDETKEERAQHYISGKESRNIAKENRKAIKDLQKKRAAFKREDYVTQMRDEKNIVEFEDLHTYFFTDNGTAKAVNGVSFSIPQGSTVGVVGESGCGKSVTSLSLMQLVQGPSGQIVSGSIRFRSTVRTQVGTEPLTAEKKDENGNPVLDEAGNPVREPVLNKRGKPRMLKVYEEHEEVFDIAKMPVSDMTSIRGREIAMIFQEPMTSLNPVFTIGYQLDEVSLLHINGATKESAKARSIEMLELVGIAMPEHVYKSYPHQLSGGMRQRVMIAMALCCNPKLIIADEPTTALDVTIQAQILDLLREVRKKISGSIMLITHDLGVIAEMVDYVVVMYAGRIVEMGTVQEIFKNPLHPYTVGLQKSKPVVRRKVDRLYSIPGNVPNPINMPSSCYFRDRCDKRCEACKGDYPEMIEVSPTHRVACHLYGKKEEV
jgi:peptide/nickel transport system ATP-binding protein